MSTYTVYFRPDVGEVGRNGERWERFERHTMYRRDGVYVFEPRQRYGRTKTVEIPMSAVLKVERDG